MSAMVAGCSFFSNNSTAILWTDRPELAVYAELYNTQTEGRKIEVVYKEAPWLALETETKHPDLAAGTRFDSVLTSKHFESLDSVIRKGRLDPARFYRGAFEMGRLEGVCYLVPVSFSLPAVIFKADLASSLPNDYIITYEEIRLLSNGFNAMDGRSLRLGYSPRWQPDFVYRLSQLFGADYTQSKERLLMWNDAKVRQTVTYAADWIETTNGGLSREKIFETRYMHDPLYKLLDTDRILFNYLMIGSYLSIPATIREKLDFRWLSDGEKIMVGDDVLFIGVPRQSRQKKTAQDFICWLSSYETQVKLLESAQFQRMRFFGIAGGLSAITAVNTDAIPRFFPFMLGHIPHSGYLAFPRRLPASWEMMRSEVIVPWFTTALSETGAAATLADAIARWRLRQPAFYR